MKDRVITYKGAKARVFENGEIHSCDMEVPRPEGIWRFKGRKLAQKIDKDGYLRVRLTCNKKRINVLSHRLVALAFIPNPNNYPCVNHKDEDKQNNNVDNLEWCSVAYNNHYKERYSRIKKNDKPIAQYSRDGCLIAEFKSIKNAAESVEGNPSNIGNCAHGRIQSAYNYVWKFINSNQ